MKMILLKAKEIGRSGTNLYAWLACAECGYERYVRVIGGSPDNLYCRRCYPRGKGGVSGKRPAGWHQRTEKTRNTDPLENELVSLLEQCQYRKNSCKSCPDFIICVNYWDTEICINNTYQISQDDFERHKKQLGKLGRNGNGKDKP